MPHKTNPRASNMIQTLSRMGWTYASGATSLLDQCDVRAASARVLNWTLVPESALAMLPPDSPPMSGGPYDAMVAVWR